MSTDECAALGAEAVDPLPPVGVEMRLRALLETGITLSSELSLDQVLEKVVATAVELTGARYGALGVLDEQRTALEQFITVGVDEETRALIGSLPRGRGILGALIADRRPLRLLEIAQDPRSVGFPPGHPPMGSFLGVPIEVRGAAFGNLYLTEKNGGEPFDEGDEEIARMLASQAGVAIENARLYDSARQWSRQLDSLNEVSEALVAESDLERILDLAVTHLRELLNARVVLIERPTPDGDELVVAAAAGDGAPELLGLRLRIDRSKAGRVLRRRRGDRIDALLDDPEVDQTVPRLAGASAAVYAPLLVHDTVLGVVAAYDKQAVDPRFNDADMRLAEAFANRAPLAIELSERVQRHSVQTLLDGGERERTRLSRELHDETGQALTSILLGLRRFESEIGAEAATHIRELATSALADVRRVAAELRPSSLDDFGLPAALEQLARKLGEGHLEVHVSIAPELASLPPDTSTALYRIIQEAATNVVKYAQAHTLSIALIRAKDAIRLLIEDDGVGLDLTTIRADALGLKGMHERAALLDGQLEIDSIPGRGTTIVVTIPAGDHSESQLSTR